MTSFAARVETGAEADLAFQCGADAVLSGGRMHGEDGSDALLVSADLVVVEFDGSRPVVAVFDARLPEAGELARIAACGCRGVLLRWPTPLVAALGPRALADVIEACLSASLSCGLEGALEPPDVPRLLPFGPDWIAVGRALRFDGRLQPEHLRLFRTLIPRAPAAPAEVAAPPRLRAPRPDRIFVRDLVVDMAVGAYGHEHGRTQRVRFTVEAEVAPRDRPVRDVGDVVSYDLLADAVRAAAGGGHVAFVETAAEAVAQRVLEDPRVRGVRVVVEKLDLGPGAMGVEIWRERVADG